MNGHRFTIWDALAELARVRAPICSADIANDTPAAREHWESIGALKVILEDMSKDTPEGC